MATKNIIYHEKLAIYFFHKAKGIAKNQVWEMDHRRGYAEVIFQFLESKQFKVTFELLSSFHFVIGKIKTGLLDDILEDYFSIYKVLPKNLIEQLRVWIDFFRVKAHILRRENDDWPAYKIFLQLAAEHADDSPLTIGAEQWLAEGRCNWFWLSSVPRITHVHQTSIIGVLEGHTNEVVGAIELTDGRLLSWPSGRMYDFTLRLWDGQNGKCLAILSGHTGWVNGAIEITCGRLLSWSSDNTLRIWSGDAGICIKVLSGHTSSVNGAQELADGKILSWSWDDTLRLWDVQSGECVMTMRGCNFAKVLNNGKIVSWHTGVYPSVGEIILWKDHNGSILRKLEGHSDRINGILELLDGRLLSWSMDKTLRLWDLETGECAMIFKGHEDWVEGAQVYNNSWIMSWCKEDDTIIVWDLHTGTVKQQFIGPAWKLTGKILRDGRILLWSGDGRDERLFLNDVNTGSRLIFEGHTNTVVGAVGLSDGRVLSWSVDGTLRIWDSCSGQCIEVLEGHAKAIFGAKELSDGRIVSWSQDCTLRLWNSHLRTNQSAYCGLQSAVKGAIVLTDGQGVTWSDAYTLKVWNIHSGVLVHELKGHVDSVRGVQVLSDGCILSWSKDGTLRVWESRNGELRQTMGVENSGGWINGAVELHDGRFLSWSSYGIMALWDRNSGKHVVYVHGHTASIEGLLELKDGHFLSWSKDNTIRIWDDNLNSCWSPLNEHLFYVEGMLKLTDGRVLWWDRSRSEMFLWNVIHSEMPVILNEDYNGGNRGALELSNGLLLTWHNDNALRLWDGHTSHCLAILKGHTNRINGAIELGKGGILSWSWDNTIQMWDGNICHSIEINLDLKNGSLNALHNSYKQKHFSNFLSAQEVVAEDQVSEIHPEWLLVQKKAKNPESVKDNYFSDSLSCFVFLRHQTTSPNLAYWHADWEVEDRGLLADGTIIATQANGKVCFLKLQHGQRRITLAEAEYILSKEGRIK